MSKLERTLECNRYDEAWNRLLDDAANVLSPVELAHERTCERCRSLSRGFEALNSYTGPTEMAAPTGFSQRVMAQLGNSQPKARHSKTRYWAGLLAIAAALVVALYLGGNRPLPDKPSAKPNDSVIAADSNQVMFAKAAKQWQEIGNDVASATRRAAETPLDLPGRIIAMKPIIDSDALNGLEPISLAFTQVGESAYESFEPIRKTAEHGVKAWFKSVSQPH